MGYHSNVSSNVLLTGGDSFTGRYVIEVLQGRGMRVFATYHGKIPESARGDVRWLPLDLEQAKSIHEVVAAAAPDLCLHLAGLSHTTLSAPQSYYAVNTVGSHALLSCLAGMPKPPRRVVVASSAAVYGTPQHQPVNEAHPLAPNSHYGCSKLAMEHMLHPFASTLPLTIVRPFNYTGPGQSEDFLVSKMVAHFRDRRAEMKLGNLDVLRDFSDVRDIARWYVRTLEDPRAPAVVNFCSGETQSLRFILTELYRLTAFTPVVTSDSALVRKNEVLSIQGATVHQGYARQFPFEETLASMLREGTRS